MSDGAARGAEPIVVGYKRRSDAREVDAAARSTYIAFGGSGFAFASWASRIPQVKEQLGLDPGSLGLVLLAAAAGAVIALPLSGPIVNRFGSRRTVAAGAVLAGAGLATVAVGDAIGVAPVVVGLFAYGIGTSTWEMAMNVQGALVEQQIGRAIMPRFHACWSIGTVAGALGGAAIIALNVSVPAHISAVAIAVATVVPLAAQRFLPDQDESDAAADRRRASSARKSLTAWREPRTLLIGMFGLAFAFAEGSGYDWINVATVDGHGARPVEGTLALTGFLGAMTACRWFGPPLLDSYGRVRMVRGLAVVAIAGLVLFVFGESTAAAIGGAVLWGAGVSFGFPVGITAGADDPRMAASRVGVITSISYCAFLLGPPLIGALGQRYTVPHALIVVILGLVGASAIAGVIAPQGDGKR
jgi:predicted MFS family arabinose efflux permease